MDNRYHMKIIIIKWLQVLKRLWKKFWQCVSCQHWITRMPLWRRRRRQWQSVVQKLLAHCCSTVDSSVSITELHILYLASIFFCAHTFSVRQLHLLKLHMKRLLGWSWKNSYIPTSTYTYPLWKHAKLHSSNYHFNYTASSFKITTKHIQKILTAFESTHYANIYRPLTGLKSGSFLYFCNSY